MKTGRTDRT